MIAPQTTPAISSTRSFCLEHQVPGSRELHCLEPFRNHAVIVCGHLYALHVLGCSRGAVGFRQPQAHRLPADGFHAGEHSPDITANLLAVLKIVGGADAPFQDDFPPRLLNSLDKHISYCFHFFWLLSEFSVYDAVRDEQGKGDWLCGKLFWIAAELAVKRPLIPVHAPEPHIQGHIQDPAVQVRAAVAG